MFVEKQEKADVLFKDLLRTSYPCLSLHGGMVYYRFLLLATVYYRFLLLGMVYYRLFLLGTVFFYRIFL